MHFSVVSETIIISVSLRTLVLIVFDVVLFTSEQSAIALKSRAELATHL
jgi:hypothetical protein